MRTQLGRGSFGVVNEARMYGTPVAVKRMFGTIEDADDLREFYGEVEVMRCAGGKGGPNAC
jgi:hypothetical protein